MPGLSLNEIERIRLEYAPAWRADWDDGWEHDFDWDDDGLSSFDSYPAWPPPVADEAGIYRRNAFWRAVADLGSPIRVTWRLDRLFDFEYYAIFVRCEECDAAECERLRVGEPSAELDQAEERCLDTMAHWPCSHVDALPDPDEVAAVAAFELLAGDAPHA